MTFRSCLFYFLFLHKAPYYFDKRLFFPKFALINKSIMQKFIYLICLLLSVIYTRSEAQIFQYIGIADGLSSRRVLSIQQGEYDYIWILTHKGIDRYNGKQFTHYPLIKNGAVVNCFPNLNIKTDREKKLWEIGKDGLVFNLNEARDSFQLVFDLHEQYPETQKCPITCIYLDEEKNIWFCTEGYQYIYNGDTQKTRKISHKIPGKVTCITQAKGNNYFISTEQTLYSATLNKGELTNVRKIDISNINIIDYIYYHKPTNKLIINALLDKLFIYTPESGELTDLGKHLKDIGVNTITPNRKNLDEVFIATDGDGVYKLDVKKKELSHFLKEDNESFNKMNGSIIKDIYMDQNNRIWNVIYPIGITIYSEKYPEYQWFKHASNSSNTLSNDCINGIMEDSEGDIWYATSNGTIRYTNLSPGNYTLKVRSILLDNQQILEEREIQILVERPFWLTFWAFLIYALFIIGAAYAFLRYQIIKRERKTSEEKINFFTHAVHDIRTPLTMIKAPLSEIMEKESLSENGQKNIQLAMQSTENLAELANNLINFQKEELYSSQTIVTAHELNHYLSNYMHQFDSFARQKDITLSYESSFDSLDVWIDTSKMDSILRNLLSNALKYTPQGGRVSLKAESNKNTWTLFLSDTGIGMNKEDQKKLFKYLFRGYNTANQTTTGCGIGMLLTYRLIENHEGKISFTSTENVGTTFQLTFPIRSKNYQYKKEEKEGTDKVLTTEQETAGNITTDIQFTDSQTDEQAPLILVVEDNAPLRSFIIHSLSDTYQVEGAGNGQEALDFINERQPDLILSDIMMPVMDGKKMCQIVKSQMETSHIPIILLTTLGDKEHILEGLEIKADQYLVKPFDVHILKATIRTLIANRKMLRNRFKSAVTALPEEAPAVELPTSLDDEFIQKVTELVKEGLGKNFNVDTLCASVNMSRTSFYNKIKALTGIAPAEFIRNIRMQEAALMLKSQRYTVAEVSDKMGFADPKYFTDTFKKFYGVPPSIYMKKN